MSDGVQIFNFERLQLPEDLFPVLFLDADPFFDDAQRGVVEARSAALVVVPLGLHRLEEAGGWPVFRPDFDLDAVEVPRLCPACKAIQLCQRLGNLDQFPSGPPPISLRKVA